MLRNGGGKGRHDPAGLLKNTELQCDGRPNDFVLPFKWDGQASRPFRPVLSCPFFPVPRHDARRIRQGFVGAKNECRILVQDKAGLGQDVGHWRIRRYTERKFIVDEAYMVHTANGLELAPAPIGFGCQGNLQLGRPGNHLEPANQAGRTECSSLMLEARRKIHDLQDGAVFRFHPRAQDCRVPVIGLGAFRQPLHPDAERAPSPKQFVKDRFAIKPRQAEPFIVATRIDQARNRPVTNNTKIEAHTSPNTCCR